MNSTRATLSWLSAPMKLAEETATHTATATPGQPDRSERVADPAAVDERHVGQQRETREGGPAEHLRGGVERELALEHARGRPRDGGQRDVDLAAPLRALLGHRRGHRASAYASGRIRP